MKGFRVVLMDFVMVRFGYVKSLIGTCDLIMLGCGEVFESKEYL